MNSGPSCPIGPLGLKFSLQACGPSAFGWAPQILPGGSAHYLRVSGLCGTPHVLFCFSLCTASGPQMHPGQLWVTVGLEILSANPRSTCSLWVISSACWLSLVSSARVSES